MQSKEKKRILSTFILKKCINFIESKHKNTIFTLKLAFKSQIHES